MTDTFKKVKSGDKLRIAASTFNAFIDSAIDYQSRQRNLSSTPQAAQRSSGIILVRNDTNTDLSRYSVLGVGAPIITPNANLDAFKNKVAVTGVYPTKKNHTGRYIITLEPLKAGVIGMAYAAGACPARISVPDENNDYPYVEIIEGGTDYLEARKAGSSAILWRQGGTGVQWALIALGRASGVAAGTARGQVLQMTSDTTYGWDYPRFW